MTMFLLTHNVTYELKEISVALWHMFFVIQHILSNLASVLGFSYTGNKK